LTTKVAETAISTLFPRSLKSALRAVSAAVDDLQADYIGVTKLKNLKWWLVSIELAVGQTLSLGTPLPPLFYNA